MNCQPANSGVIITLRRASLRTIRLTLAVAVIAGCAAERTSNQTPSARPTGAGSTPIATLQPSGLISESLPKIVITAGSLPAGMTIDDEVRGREALVVCSTCTTGFLDARMTRVGTSGPGSYWDEGGYVTWAALYETPQLASRAMEVLIAEHVESPGWGMEQVGAVPFGEDGVLLEGPAYNLGAARNFIWRVDNLILAAVAVGVTVGRDSDEPVLLAIAQAMHDRTLRPSD
jgi:hypothetical protein